MHVILHTMHFSVTFLLSKEQHFKTKAAKCNFRNLIERLRDSEVKCSAFARIFLLQKNFALFFE